MSPPHVAMHRLWLTFDDPAVEAAFRGSRVLRWAVYAFGSACLAGVWILFSAWAAVVIPRDRAVFWSGALGVLVPSIAVAVIVTRLVPERARGPAMSIGGAISVLAGGLLLIWMQLVVGEPMGGYARAGFGVYMLTAHTFVYGRFPGKQAMTWALIATWVVSAALVMHATRAQWVDGVCWLTAGQLLGSYVAYTSERQLRLIFLQRRALEAERARSEALLQNMLPASIAARLKEQPGAIADGLDAVTVLFADIVGFTALAGRTPPAQLVELLNQIFSQFDAMAQRLGVEKIKTIGDAYMIVGGAPTPRGDHASAVAAMALEMSAAVAQRSDGLQLRIGLHTGPAVAGVIGTAKYSYDLWGDTVNTASRMESHGAPGRIHVSDACRAALGDGWQLEERGEIDVKGKGVMRTWWLAGSR